MCRDVRGTGYFVFVTRHQDAIAGGNKVWLDEICTLLDGQLVTGEGVLRAIRTGTSVSDNNRLTQGTGE